MDIAIAMPLSLYRNETYWLQMHSLAGLKIHIFVGIGPAHATEGTVITAVRGRIPCTAEGKGLPGILLHIPEALFTEICN